MDKSMVSRAVKLLHDKGHLVKVKDANDNRATWLSLTDSGRQLYEEVAPNALDWESRLIRALDVSEYRDLMRIMEKLDRQLDSMDQS
jgi:DNA-binding MarR family transcriptional regulator